MLGLCIAAPDSPSKNAKTTLQRIELLVQIQGIWKRSI